jgi:hypothetical protein
MRVFQAELITGGTVSLGGLFVPGSIVPLHDKKVKQTEKTVKNKRYRVFILHLLEYIISFIYKKSKILGVFHIMTL